MEYLKLKELLKEKNITGKQLAEKLNVTENSISLIVNNKRQPRFEMLQSIAEILQVDIKDLFNSTKDSEKIYLIYKDKLHTLDTFGDLVALVLAKRKDISEVLLKHSDLSEDKMKECEERFKDF